MPALQYPFRVFANSNLGTHYDYTDFTGEWLPSQATGQSPILPEVNLATGNVIVKSTFVKTQEQIGNWEFGFVYNAQNATPWAMNIPGVVSSDSDKLIFREDDGSLVTYAFDVVQNAYVAPSGAHSKSVITKYSNTFVQFNPKTGETKHYNSAGKIMAAYDARGFSIKYAYDAQGNLKKIISAAGVYTIDHKNLTTTLTFLKTGAANPELLGSWTFDSRSRLEKAVIPGAVDYAINYAYDGVTNKLVNMRQSDGTSVSLAYNGADQSQLESIALGNSGPHYHFNYAANHTTITDALGLVTMATLNAQQCIETFNRQSLTTQCSYINGDIALLTKPNTAQTQFEFNLQGLMTQKINPNGQITQYDYDPETNACAIQRELISGDTANPIWATTRYVYKVKQVNGFTCRKLAFKISPLGAVTEYRYEAGALKSERTYLQNNYDVGELLPSTPLSLSDLQAWVLTQPKNEITLSTYVENMRGQRTVSKCFSEINTDGTGKETFSASHDRFYDQTRFGGVQNHIQKMDVASNGDDILATTTQTFDNLQRVTSHQNALGDTRSVDYSAPLQSVITEPNGRTETHAWNAAGQETSIATAIKGTAVLRVKTNEYDAAGRVSAMTDCDGQITYQLFDEINRLRFTISPTGCVHEHFYDDVNRNQGETNYYARLRMASLMPPLTFAWLQENLVKNAALDVTTYKSFDLSGRLQFEVDGRNAVIEHQYDLRNHETMTIAYDAAMTVSELNALKKGAFSRKINPAVDRVNINFYDVDGRVIVTQDPMGYVTTYQRNPAGFLLREYRYATATPVMLNHIFISPPKTADDYSKYYYPDAKGQARVITDGTPNANYVTTQAFYPTGKVSSEKKYANQAAAVPTLQSNPEALIPEKNPEDQVTTNEFDLLNRLKKKHLPKMRLQEMKYDSMGHETQQSVGDDPAQLPKGASITTQTTAKQFDDWGQLIAEAPPLVFAKILAIQNNASLTPQQKAQQIDAIWALQALRYIYDDQTGLMIAKLEIVPDDVDPTNPVNQAKTIYYCDADRRIVLTVGPKGQVQTTQWHAAFEKALEKYRYETAIDSADLSKLTGGFISKEVLALLIKNADKDVVDQYDYDGCGSETHHLDPDGFQTITGFNSFGEWHEKKLPIDSAAPTLTVARTLNLRGQSVREIKTAANGKSITTSREYNNLHGHCTSATDANGATTQFVYEPRGALFTSTDALGRTTTLTHDAFMREIKRVLPMGQGTEHVYVQISRKVKTKHLDASGDSVTDTSEMHDAFNNVILVQDAEGNVIRITFNLANEWNSKADAEDNVETRTFDLRGLLREVVSADGTKNAYHFDLNQLLDSRTLDVDGFAYIENFVNNALARCVKKTSGDSTELMDHDRRGLLKTKTIDPDGLGLMTSFSHNGQHDLLQTQRHSTSDAAVFTQEKQHDDFAREIGLLVDPSGLKIQTQKHLDAKSKVIAIVDGNGGITRHICDSADNLRYEINPKGGVIEHRYNALNQRIATITYWNAVDFSVLSDTTTIADICALIVSTPLQDKINYRYYDVPNRERYQIDTVGAVIETARNRNGLIAKEVHYATLIDSKNLMTMTTDQITAALILNENADRVTYYIYDANNQLRFLIKPDGAVIEKRYDAMKHQVAEIHYSNRVANPATIAALSVDQVLAQLTLDNSNDRYHYWYFDALGRPTFDVNAEGGVISYAHNQANQLTMQCRFAQTQTMPQDYDALHNVLKTLIPDAAKDSIETHEYDLANREIKHTDALGFSDEFGYDGVSRKTSHTDKSNNVWRTEFDAANRAKAHMSPATQYGITALNNGAVTYQSYASKKGVRVENGFDNNDNIISRTTSGGDGRVIIKNTGFDALNLQISEMQLGVPVDFSSAPASFTNRPEVSKDLIKVTVRNAHGRPLVELDEANRPAFLIYNARGLLAYRINAEGFITQYQHNAFGEVNHQLRYSAQIPPANLIQYTTTGISLALMNQWLIGFSTTGQHQHIEHDLCGRVNKTTLNKVFYANVAGDGVASPTVTQVRNAFGDVTTTQRLIVPGVYRQEQHFFNKMGECIATVSPDFHVKTSQFDAWNNVLSEVEYDAVISTAPTSYSDLQQQLAKIASPADHHHKIIYDLCDRKIAEGVLNVVTQSVNAALGVAPSVIDNAAKDLFKKMAYTPLGDIASITHENGTVEYRYYDERRNLIAVAEVARTQLKPDGSAAQIIPVTFYAVDINGNRIRVFKPALGTAQAVLNELPAPIASSPKDHFVNTVCDVRGLELATQDEKGIVKMRTHTASGKQARRYHALTNPTSTITQTTHLDEVAEAYDGLDRVITKTTLRDHAVVQITQSRHDAFHKVQEGPGDGTWPQYWGFDLAGRLWSTTKKGVPVLYVHNLAGDVYADIKSMSENLSLLTLDQLPAVVAQYANWQTYAMTLYHRALSGRLITINEPAYQIPSGITAPAWRTSSNAWGQMKTLRDPAAIEDVIYDYDQRKKHKKTQSPTITVVNEQGDTLALQPIHHHAHDEIGSKIAEIDANQHTIATMQNEAGQVVSRIEADGVLDFQNTLNAFGHAESVMDARGNVWRKEWDYHQIISITNPSGAKRIFVRNEMDLAIAEIDAAGNVNHYAFDPFANMVKHWKPMGQLSERIFDRNNLLLQESNADFTARWIRNFFGQIQQTIDGMGVAVNYAYHFAGGLTKIIGTGAPNHGSMLLFDLRQSSFALQTVQTPTPQKSYEYLTPMRLQKITDHHTGQHLLLDYDSARRIAFRKEFLNSQWQLRSTAFGYNDLGWTTSIDIDNGLSTFKLMWDLVGNRRGLRAHVKGSNYASWNLFDNADRTIVDDGVLLNGVIQPLQAPTPHDRPQGVGYDYALGRCIAQSNVWVHQSTTAPGHGKIYYVNDYHEITYNIDGFLNTASYTMRIFPPSDPIRHQLNWSYDRALRLGNLVINGAYPTDEGERYLTDHPGDMSYLHGYNANDWATDYSVQFTRYIRPTRCNPKPRLTTLTLCSQSFSDFTAAGIARIQDSTSQSWDNGFYVNDHLVNTLNIYDTEHLSMTSGERHDKYGRATSMPLLRYLDSVGHLQGVRGQDNSAIGTPWAGMPIALHFANSPDSGRPIAMWGGYENDNEILFAGVWKEFFFLPSGKVLASWDHDMGLTVVPVVKPITANTADTSIPDVVTIMPGDSARSISARYFIDPRFAPIIDAFSGVALTAGQQLPVRQILNDYNRAGDAESWQSMIEKISSTLSPNMTTPQKKPPHHSFLVELLEVIVSVVILIYIPPLALGAESMSAAVGAVGVLNASLVVAAVGALADLASQGIGITFGEQEGLNLNELLTSAIESGLTYGIGEKLGLEKWIHDRKYMKIFAEAAAVNTSAQGLEIVSGIKKQFDVKHVLENAMSAVIQAKIANDGTLKHDPLLSRTADTLSDTMTQSALSGQAPDLANALGNVVGSTAGNAALSAKKHAAQQKQSRDLKHAYHAAVARSALNTGYSSAANDDDFDLGAAYEKSLHDNTDDFYARIAAESGVARNVVEAASAVHLQRRATWNASLNWEDKLSLEIYEHQNSFWAKGIMGFAAAANSNTMHMFIHALAPQYAMNPNIAMEEAYYGRDPFTGAAVSETQAYLDAGVSAAAFVLGGAIDSVGTKIGSIADSVVSRNWASLFGRGGVANPIEKEFDDATLSKSIAKTFSEGDASRRTLETAETYSRYFGGKASRVGRYATQDIFKSRLVARNRLALLQEWGNTISKRNLVVLPKGTVVWEGEAAEQISKNGIVLPGGAQQTYIEGMDGEIDPKWFGDPEFFRGNHK